MKNVPVSLLRFRSRRGEAGYTLVELVIVAITLALIAAIAVPVAFPGNERDTDLVTEEFAAAIRFARSESIRTGQPHGFRLLFDQNRIRVFSADMSGSPWTWIWDVYHPVTRQLYDYSFPTELAGPSDPVTQSIVYRGTCNRNGVVYFDANGTPWCLDPETVLLESFRIDVTTSVGQASVTLNGITGRVTIQ
ncbi:MAG: GspH/FimT family pseudopilin [Woeseiaceae bacterium]|nr:GspH/FimT family pseudopilin [Woeseiaceae bacterium]